MLKPDRFSCSQKIQLKQDPPVIALCYLRLTLLHYAMQTYTLLYICIIIYSEEYTVGYFLICFTGWTIVLLRLLCILCHSLLMGSHPLPDQLPGKHTGPPSQMRQYLFIVWPIQCGIHSHTHSWQIEGWGLGMFQWTMCVCLCAPAT